jgi:hypothetical protein
VKARYKLGQAADASMAAGWDAESNVKTAVEAMLTAGGVHTKGIDRVCANCDARGQWRVCKRCMAVWWCCTS